MRISKNKKRARIPAGKKNPPRILNSPAKTPAPTPVTEASAAARIFVFDSIESCAGATGIPERTIKFAKKSGCPAFEGSRVVVGPLSRWLWARSESSEGIDWGERKEEYQAKREKIRLAKDRELSVDKPDVIFGLNKGMAILFDMLDRRFQLEAPPALKGRAELEIKAWLLKSIEESKKEFRAALGKLLQEPPAPADSDE